MLASAGTTPLSARTQTGWSPSAGGADASQAFVLYQDEQGETICRQATAAERQRIVERAGGPTRVIYEGAPLRSQMLYGSMWTPDPMSGLMLQPSAGLRIVLHGTTQLEQNQEAKNAFIVAANRWESIISTPITVIIDVDYGTTFFGQAYPSSGVLGATGSSSLVGPFSDLRQRLINSSSTTVEQELYNALPASAIPVEFGGVTSDVTSARVSAANARVLGIVPDISDPNSVALGQGDAGIGFNSAFQFDLNPDDGISAGLTDFDSVATHEIGHVLGFTSNSGGTAASPVSVWDLFRFQARSVSLAKFATTGRLCDQRWQLSCPGFRDRLISESG